MTNISTLGFNGEYLDSTLDSYHLGNGYRAYNPTIMAFTAPDDLSPFGAGGINPYIYCSGDPINNTDPTGHFGGFLGVVIGAINMVSPIQVPTELTLGAAEEAVLGTVVNVGVDLATDGIGAVATPVLRSVEGVVRSTTEHAIDREVEHTVSQEAGSSLDHLTTSEGAFTATERMANPPAKPYTLNNRSKEFWKTDGYKVHKAIERQYNKEPGYGIIKHDYIYGDERGTAAAYKIDRRFFELSEKQVKSLKDSNRLIHDADATRDYYSVIVKKISPLSTDASMAPEQRAEENFERQQSHMEALTRSPWGGTG